MWQTLKNKKVYIPLLVIFAGYAIFVFKVSQKPTTKSPGGTVRIGSEEFLQNQAAEAARQGEIDAIRNRTFPLAGGPNDAGMETGDEVVPVNKEPPLRTYGVARAPVITTEKFTISAEGYSLGNTASSKYGYSLPTTNGVYIDMQFTLENTQKQTALLDMTNIKQIDQEGREYLPIKQISGCPNTTSTKDPSEISVTLGPNIPCTVSVLFEVATSSNSYHVEFLAP